MPAGSAGPATKVGSASGVRPATGTSLLPRLPAGPVALLLASALALSGCGATFADIGYYWQTVKGHWQILSSARPVDQLIADPGTSEALRTRLETARQLRDYSISELRLPDNGSYRDYADLGRPFVVWNVVATPEFSLVPYQWCFPVAGCVTYRGYYDQASAEQEGAALKARDYDVQVGGVAAYSTLGWFDDPLLSTFIGYPEVELARLIFHELAHQVVYVKGDTVFNESFATAVEQLGLEHWLDRYGTAEQRASWIAWQQRRDDFLVLLQRTRARLEVLYEQGGAPEVLRPAKAAIFATLRDEYRGMRDQRWGGFKGYDRWFERDIGNAHLAAVAAYTAWVPAFRRLYEQSGGDFQRFYGAVTELSRLDPAARRDALRGIAEANTIPASAARPLLGWLDHREQTRPPQAVR